MIELRKSKLGNGGIGGGGTKNKPDMKRSGKMRRIGKTKRGREQRIFDAYMRPLIIQETAEATGLDIEIIKKYHEVDHINGRNAVGFEPLGAMFSPLNLQAIPIEVHRQKTNAATGEDQRFDFRDTDTQERMVSLNRRLVKKVGPAPTLKDIRAAIKSEIYYKGI